MERILTLSSVYVKQTRLRVAAKKGGSIMYSEGEERSVNRVLTPQKREECEGNDLK